MIERHIAVAQGVDELGVAELEGRRRPRPSTRRNLAVALRVRVEDILWP